LEVDERGEFERESWIGHVAGFDGRSAYLGRRCDCYATGEQRCDSGGDRGDEQFERFLLRVGILRSADGGSTWTQITGAGRASVLSGSADCFQYVEFRICGAATAGDNGLYVGWRRMGIRRAGLYFSKDGGCDLEPRDSVGWGGSGIGYGGDL